MKVSVAIAACNAEAYLGAAIDSILAQDFADFELLAVDDGSSDRTAAILNACEDPRLRIVTLPENCGIATARNVAMACAGGDYLAVMDADDLALPGRLGAQVRFLDRHPEVHILGARIVRFAETVANEIDRPRHPLSDGEIKANLLLLDGSAMIHPTMMARMSFIREHRLLYPPPPRGTVGIDHEFWIACVARGAVFAALPEVLLLKRRHAGNVSLRGADPAVARKKAVSRAELLGLFYPQLSLSEASALARLLEPDGAIGVADACLGIAADHKAMPCAVSYHGESKDQVRRIIAAALSRHLAALTPS
jgi:glycosyltransferase involved in cell wall biosynthesis